MVLLKYVLAVLLLASFLAVGCLEAAQGASPTPSGSVIGAPSPSPSPSVSPSAAPSPTAAAMQNEVDILYSSFEPAVIRVPVGTTVTWTNQDGRLHSVKSRESAPEQFYSGSIGGKQTFEKTFNLPGTYEYYDDLTNVGEGTVYVG